MVEIAALAKAFGVRVVPHNAYFGPGFLASLHFNAALAPDAPFERLFIDLEASPYHELVVAKDGRVTVPDGRVSAAIRTWRCCGVTPLPGRRVTTAERTAHRCRRDGDLTGPAARVRVPFRSAPSPNPPPLRGRGSPLLGGVTAIAWWRVAPGLWRGRWERCSNVDCRR